MYKTSLLCILLKILSYLLGDMMIRVLYIHLLRAFVFAKQRSLFLIVTEDLDETFIFLGVKTFSMLLVW